MGVDTKHPQYRDHLAQWSRCRDAYDGTDAVKTAATTYLPQLGGQDAVEYRGYKERALFYNCTSRTVHGLSGTIMRKAPTMKLPPVLKEWEKDVTRNGDTLAAFVQKNLDETLKIGRLGVLLDVPKAGALNIKPYWVVYRADQIVNWEYRWEQGERKLMLVVLFECVTEGGVFDSKEIEQYRVLSLTEGRYTVQLWRQKTKTTEGSMVTGVADTAIEWVKFEEEQVPQIKGAPLPYIPFVGFSSRSITLECEKPPLLDLVDVNLSHYRSSADLENGRHWCGTPQPWVSGVAGTATLTIGGQNAWKFSDANAKAGMLEFTGQGLTALEKALTEKEAQMAVLGARLLEGQPTRVQETAEAVRTRHRGEESVLATIASTFSQGITQLLKWTAEWMSVLNADTVQFELNREFFDVKLSPQELTALVTAWQSGAISFTTLFFNLKRGEVMAPERTEEDEKTDIDKDSEDDPQQDLPLDPNDLVPPVKGKGKGKTPVPPDDEL